ncbi:hypothetical protein N7510_009762 [Penicillium lagena]|uniref:uncharacterized protein n=1 Tax=Penicillium lagena TaxID=94218 RepID=UPI0025412149|nr:uncharacterized protein N7510_009762 [Penicillium lagena]KAJ5604608.1 hypothetical protein N7510_009762 [Penicillium lagena]
MFPQKVWSGRPKIPSAIAGRSIGSHGPQPPGPYVPRTRVEAGHWKILDKAQLPSVRDDGASSILMRPVEETQAAHKQSVPWNHTTPVSNYFSTSEVSSTRGLQQVAERGNW